MDVTKPYSSIKVTSTNQTEALHWVLAHGSPHVYVSPKFDGGVVINEFKGADLIAHVGEWIVYDKDGFDVYTNEAYTAEMQARRG